MTLETNFAPKGATSKASLREEQHITDAATMLFASLFYFFSTGSSLLHRHHSILPHVHSAPENNVLGNRRHSGKLSGSGSRRNTLKMYSFNFSDGARWKKQELSDICSDPTIKHVWFEAHGRTFSHQSNAGGCRRENAERLHASRRNPVQVIKGSAGFLKAPEEKHQPTIPQS